MVKEYFQEQQHKLIGKVLAVFEGVHDSPNYGYVYKTTNLINNKIYIGLHLGVFTPKYLGSGKILRDAVNKYGAENFKVELVAYAPDRASLNKLEISHIALIKKQLATGTYYNITDGGDGWSGPQTKDHIEKRKRSREANAKERGYWYTEEQLKKMHFLGRGKGRKMPKEFCEKQRLLSSMKVWICNTNLNQEKFLNKEEAQEYLNIGWVEGRLKFSDETRKNQSLSRTGELNGRYKNGDYCTTHYCACGNERDRRAKQCVNCYQKSKKT